VNDSHDHHDYSEQELLVRRKVRDLARDAGVIARYARGRRDSDVVLVILKGDKFDVLKVPPFLIERLPGFDLEIVRSGLNGNMYELILAVTENLEDQTIQRPERRAKLKRFLAREVAEG
jgi:hypothetical protein